MKKMGFTLFKVAGISALVTAVVSSCEILWPDVASGTGEGRLCIAFTSDNLTRAKDEIPDTSDFILTVSNSNGEIVYHGIYGDSPESIMVESGTYVVSAVSDEFSRPAFSSPQYGDEQCVVVPDGGVADVRLTCRQLNCGVRLEIDPGFLTGCPDGVLFLKSSQGKLMYSYSEKRTAFFHPGSISLILSRSGTDEILLTRNLKAQDMLVLGVSVAEPGAGSAAAPDESISVSVDTARNWIAEDFVIGGDNGKGSSPSEAMTVTQAKASVGAENVWVSGYIVGGDLTSSSASYSKPFKSKTCLLLGSRSSVSDRSSCLSVQLPAGDLRDALNLVDNPSLLGRKIVIKGNVTGSYYGLTGLKNCSDYKL